jgi:hypothetical protein
MVTVGEGLMFSCAIAWMFKNLPLKDWAIYCNRHGMPGIKGTTPAERGSPEWTAMEDAVAQFASRIRGGDEQRRRDRSARHQRPGRNSVSAPGGALRPGAGPAVARGRPRHHEQRRRSGGEQSAGQDETELIEEDDAEAC